MGPFGLGIGASDGNVIDLPVIVSLFPLGVEIGVGGSSDYEDCAMSGKVVGLLRR
jgi:hypothetical protein